MLVNHGAGEEHRILCRIGSINGGRGALIYDHGYRLSLLLRQVIRSSYLLPYYHCPLFVSVMSDERFVLQYLRSAISIIGPTQIKGPIISCATGSTSPSRFSQFSKDKVFRVEPPTKHQASWLVAKKRLKLSHSCPFEYISSRNPS